MGNRAEAWFLLLFTATNPSNVVKSSENNWAKKISRLRRTVAENKTGAAAPVY
jgi:hypothetical protein